MKRAARPRDAFQPDASTHQADQRRGDRAAETRTAEPAGRRAVHLVERLEDRGLFLRGNADASVGDTEMESGAALATRLLSNRHEHVTVFGELDGVAGEVCEDLLQPNGVADDSRGHVRRHVDDDFEPFLVGADGQRLQGITDRIRQ